MIRPSPGCRRTRAIAFLRRPVPRLNVSANLDVPSLIESDDLRFLRDLTVVGPGVDTKSLQHVGAQGIVLQHSTNRVRDWKRRVELLRLAKRPRPKSARVPRVPRVLLAQELGAADLELGSVDHDHVVAGVQVRREGGLVLATQDLGHAARQAAQNLIRGIDHNPIPLQIRGFRRPRFLLTQFRLLSKSLPPMSGPPREPFWAPGADLVLSAPRPPTPDAADLGPPPPAHRRCCAPGLARTLRRPAPARRNRLAAPPSQSRSPAPSHPPARRRSSSWSSRAGRQAAEPLATSRRRRAGRPHATIGRPPGAARPGGLVIRSGSASRWPRS